MPNLFLLALLKLLKVQLNLSLSQVLDSPRLLKQTYQ